MQITATTTNGRSPHGERGLKYQCLEYVFGDREGRSPHGERGLKLVGRPAHDAGLSRSPHGERGLK